MCAFFHTSERFTIAQKLSIIYFGDIFLAPVATIA
jgi:hypothetical protein